MCQGAIRKLCNPSKSGQCAISCPPIGAASKPRVVDERRTAAVPFDGQQQREAVLGDQLLSLTLPHLVGELRPLRNLAAGQEGVDEVVHQDGYVGGVNWL